MSLEAALATILTADSGVSALVGSRVYPVYLPQSPTLPAVTYEVETKSPVYAIGVGSPSEYVSSVLVVATATTYLAAKALAEACRAALDHYTGTNNGTTISGAEMDGTSDFYDPSTGLHEVAVDLIIYHG